MNEWWEAFWFFLPAGFANMSPILAARLPLLRHWGTPIDFGVKYKGERLLGANKTWRGLLFGVLVGVLVALFQYRFIASSAESVGFIVLVGAALGFGALVGDAVESYFKRRSQVPAGESWFPFDQTDYIVGGVLFASFFVSLGLADILRITLIYFGLHLMMSYVGYLTGVKKRPI